MSHLDEGTLHALLDGELDSHEVREIQAHVGSCTACDSRLQAAREVSGEADRLVATVQFPGELRGAARSQVVEEDAAPARPAAVPPRRERPAGLPAVPVDAPQQVVILPEDNNWPQRRRRLVAAGRWAALLVVAIGAGFIASEVRKNTAPTPAPFVRSTIDGESAPAAVVSPEETSRPDSALAPLAAAAAPESAPAPSPERTEEARKTTSPRVAAGGAPADEAGDRAETTQANNEPEEQPLAGEREEEISQEDVRAEAAEALADLDRQRRRDRAAAATAAIDRTRPAVEPSPPPPPAPRTLEQRSGIYLRIGLDEAARQLGRPVHVIEGMSAQFMGLVQGRQSPGADASRPVVRVVYRDSQDRMLLLDQQRVRPGQNWPSSATQWTIGEIGLLLHGEPPADVLRNHRPRVR